MGLLFEQRRVAKRYVALVLGEVPQSMDLMWPLDGKTACTRVVRLAMGTMAGAGSVSLVRAEPVTGRTHQIRRHLFAAGHGIVGDDRTTSLENDTPEVDFFSVPMAWPLSTL